MPHALEQTLMASVDVIHLVNRTGRTTPANIFASVGWIARCPRSIRGTGAIRRRRIMSEEIPFQHVQGMRYRRIDQSLVRSQRLLGSGGNRRSSGDSVVQANTIPRGLRGGITSCPIDLLDLQLGVWSNVYIAGQPFTSF